MVADSAQVNRRGEAVSRVGRADGGDLADQVPEVALASGPVADHAHEAARPGGHLGAGADQ